MFGESPCHMYTLQLTKLSSKRLIDIDIGVLKQLQIIA